MSSPRRNSVELKSGTTGQNRCMASFDMSLPEKRERSHLHLASHRFDCWVENDSKVFMRRKKRKRGGGEKGRGIGSSELLDLGGLKNATDQENRVEHKCLSHALMEEKKGGEEGKEERSLSDTFSFPTHGGREKSNQPYHRSDEKEKKKREYGFILSST